MLTAVTFDLWETLILEDPQAEHARRDYRLREIGRILKEHGLPVAADALERAHRDVLQRMDPFWGANLDVSVVEQTRMLLEIAFGASVDAKLPPVALLECSRHYGEAALVHLPRVAEGARAVLASAKAAGLRLALLCNTGRTPGKVLRDILQKLELKSYFDALFFSDEVRLRKPAPEFFQRALSRLGVPPEAALHVGDQPETDLSGARAAGMWTVYMRHEKSPEVPPSMADYTIRSINDLPPILGRLIGVQAPPSVTPVLPMPPPTEFGKETTHL